MKKILLLLLIFLIKLNAYEYIYYQNSETENLDERFFYDSNGKLISKRITSNGVNYTQLNYNIFNSIKRHTAVSYRQYIGKEIFKQYYVNDIKFLNDLYLQLTNIFLNYLYNDNVFSNQSYIQYNEYELLYNSDGLVIASIVNDKWAGLYDNDTRFASGKLYDKTGTLQYINGKAVKQMSPFDMINELFIVSVQEIFGLISRTMCYVIGVVVVLVFAAFLFCLDLLHSSLSVRERLGSPWIATFDEKGKRVSKWGRNPNYFYHSSFNGPRNFPSWRDYMDYERKLSDDSSSSNYRKKVF